MKEYIVPDDFLDTETIASAKGQGYLHEIVRCKDCGNNICGRCRNLDLWVETDPEWFCADGRRKEDDA